MACTHDDLSSLCDCFTSDRYCNLCFDVLITGVTGVDPGQNQFRPASSRFYEYRAFFSFFFVTVRVRTFMCRTTCVCVCVCVYSEFVCIFSSIFNFFLSLFVCIFFVILLLIFAAMFCVLCVCVCVCVCVLRARLVCTHVVPARDCVV